MPEVSSEYQHSYAKITFSRKEIIEKLGFDPDDAFNVELVDWGRGGIKFTLNDGKSAKYTQPEPPSQPEPPRKLWGRKKQER